MTTDEENINMKKEKYKLLILVVFIILCEAVGIISGLFTRAGLESWYPSLIKSSLTPPSIVFGIVWPILYALMGISIWLIWRETKKQKQRAYSIFSIQLILNFLWSIIFFGLQKPFIAAMELILLYIAVILTTKEFYKLNKTASYLLIPYILWLTLALVLNISIVVLN